MAFPFIAEWIFQLILGAIDHEPADIGRLTVWMILAGVTATVGGHLGAIWLFDEEPIRGVFVIGSMA
ncbi:MAG: hypothetical protein ACR2QK_19105, partial [Acidimicrobiales bacterium]